MLIITEEQKKELEKVIPNLQVFIEQDTDEDLLQVLDELILDEYDDDQNNLSLKGIQLQKIYDEIYMANES